MTQRTALALVCLALVTLIAAAPGCVHGGDRRDPPPPDATADTPEALDEDAPVITTDDADGDGVPAPADCDDTNPLVYPGALEDCTTATDEDCDGFGGATPTDLDPDCDEDIDEGSDEDDEDDDDDDE